MKPLLYFVRWIPQYDRLFIRSSAYAHLVISFARLSLALLFCPVRCLGCQPGHRNLPTLNRSVAWSTAITQRRLRKQPSWSVIPRTDAPCEWSRNRVLPTSGQMRWKCPSPERNLFLIDGKMAWFYVPADHTVTRVPAKQSGDWRTPFALLAGEMKVSRVCARIEPALRERAENASNAVFTCALRGSMASKTSAGKTLARMGSSPNGPTKKISFFSKSAATPGRLRESSFEIKAELGSNFILRNGGMIHRSRKLYSTSRRRPAWPS